ncbi:MAG: response regulator [Spirochaetaceae bacterium]|jgi:putative two-component system response regulator|nr:response regulator [Spirochaetaceae bacterium]
MEDQHSVIMLVDDNIANLKIGKNALVDTYDVYTAPSAAKMFELLERNIPSLILLDINMPEMDGYEAIKLLKEKERTRDIPVVFLTGKDDPDSEFEGLSLGAIDYIAKPFSPPLLRKRIEVHLLVEDQKKRLTVQNKTLEIQRRELQNFNDNLQQMVTEKTHTVLELQNAILKTVADLVECRDDITGGHIERTQRGLRILVNALLDQGLYPELFSVLDIELFLQSSQLHDVGKIAISDQILKKPGPLTKEEFDNMKQHTTFGVKIIEKIEAGTSACDFLDYAKILAGSHHEKWNGQGYPLGQKGDEIPIQGRLMAIADVYDALTSERPYKKAFSHEEAVQIILEGRGTHFDPLLTDMFEKVSEEFRTLR